MAKQIVNLGTSANKGDGDPLRTAFDKVNDNFTELYLDLKQVKSAQTGGGTLIVDTIGSVHATDSTLLVDGVNNKIVGSAEPTSFKAPMLTQAAIDALTVAEGLFVYNTTTGKFQGYAADANNDSTAGWADLH